MRYILIFGNPVDGFNYRGPFDTHEDAHNYGDPIIEEWWIAELTPPDYTCLHTGLPCIPGCNHTECAGLDIPLNQWPTTNSESGNDNAS